MPGGELLGRLFIVHDTGDIIIRFERRGLQGCYDLEGQGEKEVYKHGYFQRKVPSCATSERDGGLRRGRAASSRTNRCSRPRKQRRDLGM